MNRTLLPIALMLFSGCATKAPTTTAPIPSTSIATGAAMADASATHAAMPAPTWDFNATIIEACSCPMFCQCYFNSRPAGVGCCAKPDDPLLAQRFCRFNNAIRVNHGSYDGTKLDGMKFWIAGDLGSDFSQGQMNWAVLHYEPSATKEQREAVMTILGALYPVKWSNFSVGRDATMEWTGGKDRSVARLDGGKLAEVVLKRNQGMTDEPIVMHNLKYWGAPRNDGFLMMANEVEAYRDGTKSYEFKGTNGFMITLDITSKDVAAAKDAAAGKKGY